jgi:hypothetical protein
MPLKAFEELLLADAGCLPVQGSNMQNLQYNMQPASAALQQLIYVLAQAIGVTAAGRRP